MNQREKNLSQSQSGPAVTPDRIMQMTWGFGPPLILEAAVRNRVFDVLDQGAKTLEEVAQQTGASKRGVRAIMDALVGLELLRKEQDRYALAPDTAAFLVSGKPGFRGGFLRHLSTQMIPKWLTLAQTVKAGKSQWAVNQEGQGAEFFKQFVEDLYPTNYPTAAALAEYLLASGALAPARAGEPVRVLDIAAGSGVWGIALAQKSRDVHVTAVDWPLVCPVAMKVARERGVGDRYRTIEGDLLETDFGSGYRVAILGHILHSEGESRSRKLLRKVYDALSPGGTIAIAEFVPNDQRTGPPMPLIFAVNMLVATEQGDTFTFAQMTSWLKEAGFHDPRQLEAPGPSPLLLANK